MGPKKKTNQKKKTTKNDDSKKAQSNGIGDMAPDDPDIDNEAFRELADQMALMELESKTNRSTTGVLLSHADARDLHLGQVSVTYFGQPLLEDADLELNFGRRYGLIGPNGCGKSTLLQVIATKEIPIPHHFDTYLLSREVGPSNKTALQCVIDVDSERKDLEAESEELALKEDEESQTRLMDIYDRLEFLEADKAEMRASAILSGLGFTPEMMNRKAKEFSGGWRMRIALARALYLKPTILLLDEPTNHLDLESTVWLETVLSDYQRILVIISHSQDFLNGVCTNILHMQKNKIKLYGGNYDQFMQTRMELETNQMKQYKWEQTQIAHMKNYIARFGHGSAKLARQAQSKEKTLKRMIDGGLSEKVIADKTIEFGFPDPGELSPPVIMVQNVGFRYSPESPLLYRNLDFGVDLDTRVAIVGPNGAGKTTLLKLISGELTPTEGEIRRHSHVRVGRFHQHLTDHLDLDMGAVEWMQKEYPDIKELDDMRKIVGRYGLTGAQQMCKMRQLSDGQRCRVVFSWLAQRKPHLLMLDEPTNHLDIETIDSLADALNAFDGGLILVSHDFRLISQVVEEIWLADKNTVKVYEAGDIFEYKKLLQKRIRKRMAKNEFTI